MGVLFGGGGPKPAKPKPIPPPQQPAPTTLTDDDEFRKRAARMAGGLTAGGTILTGMKGLTKSATGAPRGGALLGG
jgi:hypothetical protein